MTSAELPGLVAALELVYEQTKLFDCSRKQTAGRIIQAKLIERIKQCDTKKEFEFLYLLPSS